MRTKDLGAAHEIEFALECIERGAIVSQPFGDNASYDLILDFIVSKCSSSWYIWKVDDKFPTSIKAYPKGDATQKWENGRDNWSAVGLPAFRLAQHSPEPSTEDGEAVSQNESSNAALGGELKEKTGTQLAP